MSLAGRLVLSRSSLKDKVASNGALLVSVGFDAAATPVFSVDDFEEVRPLCVRDPRVESTVSVVLMRHKGTGAEYAVKTIIDTLDEKHHLQTLKELALMQRARSEHTVALHGYAVTGEKTLFFMEYLPDTLEKLLGMAQRADEHIPEDMLAVIAVCLLDGLQFLQQQQPSIAHRDVKPSNVLLGSNGAVKLCDFGESKAYERGQLAKTCAGTKCYLPPARVDPRFRDGGSGSGSSGGGSIGGGGGGGYNPELSDVWAYGISLVELAARAHPFAAVDRDDLRLMLSISDTPSPAPPPHLYSASFADFVACCLRKSAAERAPFAILQQHEFVARARAALPTLQARRQHLAAWVAALKGKGGNDDL
jgi:serine/threonine protein kinase